MQQSPGTSTSPLLWHSLSFLLSFVVVAIVGSRTFISDGLLGLYLGRYIDEQGIPRVDDITVEGAGRTWIDQQWLAQLAYFRAWELGGYTLVALTSAVAISLAFVLLSVVLLRRGVPGLQVLAWVGLALAVVVNNTLIRAQSFALPAFMIVVALLLADERSTRPRAVVWLPLLATLALWANLHGSVLLTIPPVIAWAVVRAWRARADRRASSTWLACAVLAPCTILATPYGIAIVDYYRSVIGNETIALFISEWQPADPTSRNSLPFLLFLLFTTIAVAYRWGRGVRPSPLLLGLVVWFGLIGTQAIRYHMWVAIPGVLLLSSILQLPTSERDDDARRARRLLMPVGALLAVMAIAIGATLSGMSEREWMRSLPVEQVDDAARWLEQHPDARILADDQSAPVLLWLHPDVASGRVGFDARLEHFGADDLREFIEFVDARTPDWLDATDGYDAAIISSEFHPQTIEFLEDADGWSIESRGSKGIFVVRAPADGA